MLTTLLVALFCKCQFNKRKEELLVIFLQLYNNEQPCLFFEIHLYHNDMILQLILQLILQRWRILSLWYRCYIVYFLETHKKYLLLLIEHSFIQIVSNNQPLTMHTTMELPTDNYITTNNGAASSLKNRSC